MVVLSIAIMGILAAIAFLWWESRGGDEQKPVDSSRPHATTPVPVPPMKSWPARVEGFDTTSSGQTLDKCDPKKLRHDLKELLDGKSVGGYRDLLRLDGVFCHRSGICFTVYHGKDRYVIVRALTKTSSTVTRIVMNRVDSEIWRTEESRILPADGRAVIGAEQSRNTDVAGLAGFDDSVELAFVVGELANSTRVKGLE